MRRRRPRVCGEKSDPHESESPMRFSKPSWLIACGMLMMSRATRWIGGALVAGTSATVLTSEIRHGDTKLALPRGLVMLAALAAVVEGLKA